MIKAFENPPEPTAVTPEVRRALLGRVLASRHFAHAHVLKRVLRYLSEEYSDPDVPGPKEYEIAVQAMGRPASFDPRIDPIVRVTMGNIRERFAAYFSTEGRHEPIQMLIPRGQYRVDFVPVQPEVPAGAAGEAGEAAEMPAPLPQTSAVSLFWQPYLESSAPSVIGYTEPLFFRNDKGLYVRDWFINNPSSPPPEIGGGDKSPLRPSYHYLSSGEVHSLLSLTRMFHEMGVPVETCNTRLSSWRELRHSNLILLGCPRTNPFMASLEGACAFRVNPDHIENLDPAPGEESIYNGKSYREGNLERRVEYAVVTRRPGFSPGCTITSFASNHGRAVEGVSHLFTLEDQAGELLRKRNLRSETGLPRYFQLLMRVETIDVDDEIVHVECISHRVLPVCD